MGEPVVSGNSAPGTGDPAAGDAGVGDAAVRREALRPGRSFLVQAPAGSGKTALLTQRFLALLARVEHPEEVVAITFTRKAAGEMRARVLGALRTAREGRDPPTDHERATVALAREVLTREQEAGWELADSPSRLRIMTIDALCGAITRHLPWLSRFGGQPATAQDSSPLYQRAAMATLEELEKDGPPALALERLLVHLDNNPGRVQTLLQEMLARRDHWLRHLSMEDPAAFRATLEATLAAIAERALALADARMPPVVREKLPAQAAQAAENLVVENPDSPITACQGLSAMPPVTTEALPQWLGLATVLLTGGGDWRKTVTRKEGFPPASEGGAAEKEAILALLEGLRENGPLREALQSLRLLPALHLPDAQWEVMEALLQLLPLAVEKLRRAFAGTGEVDYAEVALGAAAALGGASAVQGGASAAQGGGMDFQLRHLLVDEFQDTSFSQFQLLERLTHGWQPEDGRTLFLVGDPMQSIYGFREAEVGLFLQARQRGLGTVQLHPLQLSLNFRSQQGVVDWLNAHFPALLPREEDPLRGAVAYSPSAAVHPPAPGVAVTFHPFPANDVEAEAAQVVELVRAAQQEHPEGAVAILVRARTHLAAILPALKAARIPFRAVGIDPLAERPAVADLLALTRALEHPADRVAWLAVLRSPLCGLRLEDLLALAGGDPAFTIWAALEDNAAAARLTPDGAQRTARLRETLQPVMASRERGLLRTRVEGAWVALGGPAALAPDELGEARAFLDLLEALESEGATPAMARLEQKTRELRAPPHPTAGEGLTLMTIHTAKGLEFDTVIVPGLGKKPRASGSPLMRWEELPPTAETPGELVLAPIGETGASKEPTYQYLARLAQARAEHEVVRLLYVAITRAARRVHLLGHAMPKTNGEFSPASGSLLKHLWPVVADQFSEMEQGEAPPPGQEGETSASSDPAPTPPANGPPLRRLPQGWSLPPPPPSIITGGVEPAAMTEETPRLEFAWAGDTARHVGTAVHAILEKAGRPANGGAPLPPSGLRPRLTAVMRRLGVAAEDLEAALEKAEAAVRNTFSDPTGLWLLHGHPQAENELALTAVMGAHVVQIKIDRTFVDDQGVRWIVDYKTGGHLGGDREAFLNREQERYRPQLEQYAHIMRSHDPHHPIRLGLYFPLFQEWRTWQPEGVSPPPPMAGPSHV